MQIEKRLQIEDKIRRQYGQNVPKLGDPIQWANCKSIYKWLSHYYIKRRSVVFIVDTQFDSMIYRDRAMAYLRTFFKHRLDGEDYFGFISLEEHSRAEQD